MRHSATLVTFLSAATVLLWATARPAAQAAAVPAGQTQQPVTEHVVVTAHAEPVPFDTLAREVVVITREEIARLPVRTVAEVLAYAASVDVRSRGPFGVQSDFSVRGATFGQALVLVDGVRLNDAQSGHHNADIPVPLEQIDRIEMLSGPGSSLYGADAFGGTINIITRRDSGAPPAAMSIGSFGFVSGDAAVSGSRGSVSEALSASADRSSGFAIDRDFRTLNVSSQTRFGAGPRLWVSHLQKDFGANGFYGPAQSTEQTNQTLLSAEDDGVRLGGWDGEWQGSYRTHGDEFLYDSTRAGVPNVHRTHAIQAGARVRRPLAGGTRLTIGGETGGDWIRSNNLGDHALSHVAGYAEVQHRIGRQTFLYPAIRYDRYSTFGGDWSPSLAASTWASTHVKLRASVGRAFRVPTFTERFYIDPNNLGTPTLAPEHAWASEIGADWVGGSGWSAGLTGFDRRERDTIDFVRASAQEPWRAANVRRVGTRGMEMSLRRALGTSGIVSAEYTFIDADTDPLPLLSKYVLEYARQSVVLSGSLDLPGRVQLGQRLDYKRRRGGAEYWLVDTRIARPIGRVTVFIDGTNLLSAVYQEVPGVEMPGRSVRAGIRLGPGR